VAAPFPADDWQHSEALTFDRLWKRSWALRVLARFACQDADRLVRQSEDLIALARRSRLRLI
jgi:hypothetical protein